MERATAPTTTRPTHTLAERDRTLVLADSGLVPATVGLVSAMAPRLDLAGLDRVTVEWGPAMVGLTSVSVALLATVDLVQDTADSVLGSAAPLDLVGLDQDTVEWDPATGIRLRTPRRDLREDTAEWAIPHRDIHLELEQVIPDLDTTTHLCMADSDLDTVPVALATAAAGVTGVAGSRPSSKHNSGKAYQLKRPTTPR